MEGAIYPAIVWQSADKYFKMKRKCFIIGQQVYTTKHDPEYSYGWFLHTN